MSSITGCDTERASSKTPRGATPFERPYRALLARFQVMSRLCLICVAALIRPRFAGLPSPVNGRRSGAADFGIINCKGAPFSHLWEKVALAKQGSDEGPRGQGAWLIAWRFAVFALLALGTMSPARAEPLRVLAFGDSLTAGLMLPAAAAFPAQLERRLRADGFDATVINAGVSGDTTAGGLARADFALGEGADLVILELGANDMLRGVDPKLTSANLDKIVTEIEARKVAILLAGMVASGNFGPDYKARFDAVFPDLAARRGLPLYPFFLSGVAGDKALVMPDGLHPNVDGVARIVTGIAPLVEENLARLKLARERQAPH
jgi:acyl-CoA thioesterase-1